MRLQGSHPRPAAWLVSIAVAAVGAGLLVGPADATVAGPTDPAGAAPISPGLATVLADGASHEFWVLLDARADNTQARGIADWGERGTRVAANLRAVAERSQAPVRALLTERGVPYESFWVTNAVRVVGGDLDLARALAVSPGVEGLVQPPAYDLDEPLVGVEQPAVGAVEWGVSDIGADEVWERYGVTGEGIVVANIDTGVDGSHPALVGQYRGNVGGELVHDYSWFDPRGETLEPTDGGVHGTHTMGTVVGSDGGTRQIGVAPGARWIASNAISTGAPREYLAAMQWMLEPRDLSGQNPDASRRPHVITNSWGISGNPGNPFGDDVQQAWIDSGIFATWSNRNDGPRCDTTGSPGGRALSYSNGAYDIEHEIAPFSSRGPGQDGMVKPDISAPGVDIRSAVPGGGYRSLSGTSMSTPHTAGAVALLWSAAPALVGDVERTREILDQTAVDVDATACGGTLDDNNVFGEGRLDVLAAIAAAPVGERVTGRATDRESGQPLAAVEIDFSGVLERRATTRDDGTYDVRLLAGEYDVVARKFRYLDAETTVQVEGGATTVDVSLQPAETHLLVGRVRDRATGDRLEGIPVALAGTPLRTTTNARGGYRYRSVPTGTYAVTAEGGRCHSSRTKPVVVDGERPGSPGPDRKRLRLASFSDAFGHTCRTESSRYVKGDTRLELADGAVTTVDLPFPFDFYGEQHDEVQVSANGHLRFVPDSDAAPDNLPVPDPAQPDAVVAGLWDSLFLDGRASVWTRSRADAFTVEYRNVGFLEQSFIDRVSFTITLERTGEIVFAYRGVDPKVPRETGSSATIGIEDHSGSDGLQYGFDEHDAVTDDRSIRFLPPGRAQAS